MNSPTPLLRMFRVVDKVVKQELFAGAGTSTSRVKTVADMLAHVQVWDGSPQRVATAVQQNSLLESVERRGRRVRLRRFPAVRLRDAKKQETRAEGV